MQTYLVPKANRTVNNYYSTVLFYVVMRNDNDNDCERKLYV